MIGYVSNFFYRGGRDEQGKVIPAFIHELDSLRSVLYEGDLLFLDSEKAF
jgi:hypothetical protein